MFKKNDWINTIFGVISIISLSACAPQVKFTSTPVITPTQAPPVTLHLAIYDDPGSPIEPYVFEFVNQVKTLSGGNITIEPLWSADANSTPSLEQNVIQAVIEGQYELGLVASRSWDIEKVTSFQALQAPFLITNDALAIAVAKSDIARQMLDSLSPAGVVGLTLWPEDLRHPFSVVPGKSLLSPADFTGLQVRVPPSVVSDMLFQQLGATPINAEDGYQGAESGLRQGGTLSGKSTATGNVTFYAKFQVLFANGAAFKHLSQAQQAFLNEAAAAAQKKALAEHPSDADAGINWCKDQGYIVLANAEQVAAFEKAAQPVLDWVEKDPANSKWIAAIRDLKAKTTPSAGAAACQP
jgi:TRAP-type C4-dicarboxylate transport system substrate-binding protein